MYNKFWERNFKILTKKPIKTSGQKIKTGNISAKNFG
jgi:hypothetical protein